MSTRQTYAGFKKKKNRSCFVLLVLYVDHSSVTVNEFSQTAQFNRMTRILKDRNFCLIYHPFIYRCLNSALLQSLRNYKYNLILLTATKTLADMFILRCFTLENSRRKRNALKGSPKKYHFVRKFFWGEPKRSLPFTPETKFPELQTKWKAHLVL